MVSGSVDTTTYLFDSLCKGICVVLPTEAVPSSWLITKTSREVSIKTDFTSFRKFCSSNSDGRMIFGTLLMRLDEGKLTCSFKCRFRKKCKHYMLSG